MQKYQLHGPATVAASVCGIAFVALIVIFPIILNDVAQMEEELILHRDQYQIMSNTIWDYLMQQSQQLRLSRSVRRSQLDGNSKEDTGRNGAEEGGGGYGGEEGNGKRYGSRNGGIPNGVKGRNGCPRGPVGPPGEPGERGENGIDGLPGKEGVGAVYESPREGPCSQCPPGRPGLPGYKGRRGPRGPVGKKGEPGMPGRDGMDGEEGPEGDAGQPGPQGPPGENGEPGQDGYQYARGPPGEKGAVGPSGPEGDQGPPGERGDEGEIGLPGEPGRPGPRGVEGPMGISGPTGLSGIAGVDGEYCPCPPRNGRRNGAGYSFKQPVDGKSEEDGGGRLGIYRKIEPKRLPDETSKTTDSPPGIRPRKGTESLKHISEEETALGDKFPSTKVRPSTTKEMSDEAETAQPYRKHALAKSLRQRH